MHRKPQNVLMHNYLPYLQQLYPYTKYNDYTVYIKIAEFLLLRVHGESLLAVHSMRSEIIRATKLKTILFQFQTIL